MILTKTRKDLIFDNNNAVNNNNNNSNNIIMSEGGGTRITEIKARKEQQQMMTSPVIQNNNNNSNNNSNYYQNNTNNNIPVQQQQYPGVQNNIPVQQQQYPRVQNNIPVQQQYPRVQKDINNEEDYNTLPPPPIDNIIKNKPPKIIKEGNNAKSLFTINDKKNNFKLSLLVVLLFILLNSKLIWSQIQKLPMMGNIEPSIIALLVNSILSGIIFYFISKFIVSS
jgi:hypothetical protein